MRERLIGVALLVAAIAIAWMVVAIGQAKGGNWIAAAIGPDRLASDAPMVETLFILLIFVPFILIGIVAAALVDRRNALALGSRPLAGLAVGLLIGLVGVSVTVLYAYLAGALTIVATPATALIGWGLGVIALQVAAEEIYFRGWLQPALARRWGKAAAIFASAVAFAALHVAGGARAPVSLFNLFLGGLMFGLFAARGGGLAAAVGAHFAWNAAEQLGYGLEPNPGLGSFGALADWELTGTALWGGSDQGLNGSFGMTLVLLAILVPLVALPWRVRPVLRPATT